LTYLRVGDGEIPCVPAELVPSRSPKSIRAICGAQPSAPGRVEGGLVNTGRKIQLHFHLHLRDFIGV